MSYTDISAYIFLLFATVVSLFQLALALGASWGEMAMGGKIHGRFPLKLRFAAVFQLLLIVFSVIVVLVRAKLYLIEYFELSRTLIWFVVAIFSISLVLNSITSSKKERLLGVPLAIILSISSIYVALS